MLLVADMPLFQFSICCAACAICLTSSPDNHERGFTDGKLSVDSLHGNIDGRKTQTG